jgi:peptide/nickel transport system ATP-binding protein/oligopeptide transport system ATP-binding protein
VCTRVTPPLKRYAIDGRDDHYAACHLIDAPESAAA